ncbi:MAG: hypothetical protein WCW17_03825 [Patescibacteria group bacterium]|jgi:DNA-binding transcriptional regulator PaaX
MKKEIKEKVKNFTLEIIDLFLEIPENFINAFDRKEFYRIINGSPTPKKLTRSNISKILNNLKNNGYIQIEKTSTSESIKFTNKAKLAVIDRLAMKKISENFFCFVSFDIPEEMKINRNRFRRAIKKIGFHQIQKSLWVSNKNLGGFVDLAAEEYGVSDYVVYFISDKTNITDYINNLISED